MAMQHNIDYFNFVFLFLYFFISVMSISRKLENQYNHCIYKIIFTLAKRCVKAITGGKCSLLYSRVSRSLEICCIDR